MKARELRELTNAELATRMEEAYREMFNLRVQKAVRQLSNTRRVAEVRHDIARIKTMLRERELGEAFAAEATVEEEGTGVGG